MMEVRKTEIFAKWLDSLSDIQTRSRILARIERLADGDKRTQARDIKTAICLAKNL
jgi:putative component of toxin-antitoxin plasmid stabilization module